MINKTLRRLALTLSLGLLPCPLDAQTGPGSPWGLRNIETLNGSVQLPHFLNHAAGFSHGWVLWNSLEPSQGVFDWSTLDDRIDTAIALGAVPVVLLHMNAAWVQTCPTTGPCPNPDTGPWDLAAEPHPVTAFSPILYNTTQQLVARIATKYPTGDLYLRFHNEPFDDWPLGSKWTRNIRNYERCIRTFRKAARDKAAELGGTLKRAGLARWPTPRSTVRQVPLRLGNQWQ